MPDEGDMLNALAGRLIEVSSVVSSQNASLQSLEKELIALKSGKSNLPNYFGNKDQIIEELEAQGYGKKDEPGLQDDLHDAFRMFTEVTPEGRLVEGLQHGNRPASLTELFQTMDLRGLIWNYGLGWISAFKGGYNIGAESGKDNAKNFIKEVKEKTIVNTKELAEFMKNSYDLDDMGDAKNMLSDQAKMQRYINHKKTWEEYNQTFKKPRQKRTYKVGYLMKNPQTGELEFKKLLIKGKFDKVIDFTQQYQSSSGGTPIA